MTAWAALAAMPGRCSRGALPATTREGELDAAQRRSNAP